MIPLTIPRERLRKFVTVVLRVPSLFIIELWFRTDPIKTVDIKTPDAEFIVTVASYLALVLAFTLATLPLRKLVELYMYIVSSVLIITAHYLSAYYIQEEEGENGYTTTSLYDSEKGLQRLTLHLAAQCFIGAMITYLIEFRHWTKYCMLIYTAPMLARLVGILSSDLHAIHTFSSCFALIMILLHLFNKVGIAVDAIKKNIMNIFLAVKALGLLSFAVALWHAVLLPAQLLVFWLFMFVSQLYVYAFTDSHPLIQERWLIVFLASIGECCATPISLFALCATISYASYFILSGTKLYLQGWDAYMHDNMLGRGWTEGATMLLIAFQTGLLELQPLQRAFLMSILLFIVATSLIQSMYEITDPILLTLSASRSKSVAKHVRALVLCTFLWIFPLYMSYAIIQYFEEVDFWLLIIISSCLLTSIQVLGSLLVYGLFLYDTVRKDPWEYLDDVVYYAKSTTRVFEFIVAVLVVCYGVKETLFGEWSWLNSGILVIHCYFNVWQRLQSGWKSFLLRREAMTRVESLPHATQDQLDIHDDVCSICYQQLKVARVTPCGHFFHSLCLRKWLYIKDACPFCHQNLAPPEAPAEAEGNNAADLGNHGDNEGDNGHQVDGSHGAGNHGAGIHGAGNHGAGNHGAGNHGAGNHGLNTGNHSDHVFGDGIPLGAQVVD